MQEMAVFGVALLGGRLVVGVLMLAHGLQKLFGWFQGQSLERTGEFFTGLGFRPGIVFAAAAGLTEAASGVLIMLGFLGPLGPALLISVMIVAAITVHRGNGLLSTSNGNELPVLYATAAFCLAAVGPGMYSVDALLGLTVLWSPA